MVDQVKEVSKIQTTETSKKKIKDIDFGAVHHGGPLYVDPKYKKPGFVYCLPTTEPSDIDRYTRLGWEIVRDPEGNINAGSDKPSASSALGTAVIIQSRCGRKHILMERPEELHEREMKYRSDQNKKQMSALGYIDGIPPKLQTGSLTITHK